MGHVLRPSVRHRRQHLRRRHLLHSRPRYGTSWRGRGCCMRTQCIRRLNPHVRCWGDRHRMLLRRSKRRLWLLPWMLLCHMLVSMVMPVIGVELRHSSWVYVGVREMVLYHGEPQWVVEEVMVMVVVMGPKRRERYRHEGWGRRHRE